MANKYKGIYSTLHVYVGRCLACWWHAVLLAMMMVWLVGSASPMDMLCKHRRSGLSGGDGGDHDDDDGDDDD